MIYPDWLYDYTVIKREEIPIYMTEYVQPAKPTININFIDIIKLEITNKKNSHIKIRSYLL